MARTLNVIEPELPKLVKVRLQTCRNDFVPLLSTYAWKVYESQAVGIEFAVLLNTDATSVEVFDRDPEAGGIGMS